MIDKQRVLVVDDDLATRVLSCIMLERAQLEPIRCASAEAALAMLGDDTFELLVTDLDLPVMDGIGLIQVVRRDENTQNMPVLLLVKKKDVALVKTALDAGANNFMMRPILFHSFVAVVRLLLAPPIAY
jgi:DNA-binding response OmpR family regulator